MSKSEVVITGMGVVAPNGIGLENFWTGITEGRSGVSHLDRFDAEDFTSQIAATVDDYEPSDHFGRKEQRRLDTFVQYGIVAAREAVKNAGFNIDNPEFESERAGVVIGSGIGGIGTIEKQHKRLLDRGPRRISPYLIPKLLINIVAGQVAIEFDCQGPNQALVTACATGTHSIGDAMRFLNNGEADVMLAGGSEAGVTPLGFGGFCAIKALSTRNDEPERASRPFDAERDGFVMGEGAGVLVLETREHAEKRGAEIYAEVAGFGQSCDAHHITAPREDGKGAISSMRLALKDAGLQPEEVQYVNAHGTSTLFNDKSETKAIREVFGTHADDLLVSSIKSTTGHLLGAAGAVEAIASALAIRRGVVPPTVNYENPDPDCDLYYVPNKKESAEVNAVISNNFGFGGHNATLVLRKAR